jgi:hypothetical protein
MTRHPDYSPNNLLPRLKVLRCEVRLKGARACERVGIESLSCLSSPKKLFRIWRRIFDGLLDEASRTKLFENSYVSGSAVQRLEKMIRSKGARVSNISTCVAGIGGIEALKEALGGDRGLELWIRGFDIPSYKRSRLRRTFNKMSAYCQPRNSQKATKKALFDFKEWAMNTKRNPRRKKG